MNNLPSSPLKSLLSKAAKQLPKQSGEVQQFRDRFDRAGSAVVLICDTSGSMDESAGGRKKIDHLHEALDSLSRDFTHGISFNSSVTQFQPGTASRFSPSGGTDLASALRLAITLSPSRSIVISDGQPNDAAAALAEAAKISGVIDVIYCGHDTDQTALRFMQSLARAGCGQVRTISLQRIGSAPIAAAVRGLIGGAK